MSTNPTTESAMYRTMHRQPNDMRRVLANDAQIIAAADLAQGASRYVLTGIGTSYHAALAGSWLLRSAGFNAVAISSADLWLYPDQWSLSDGDTVIVFAHTGARVASAAALKIAREAGATVISVGSTTAEHPGSQLILRTIERETSAAYTSSHLCAMTTMAQLAIELGERASTGRIDGWKAELERIPEHIARILDREIEVASVARAIVGRPIYATGGGPSEVSALELVIKAREAAQEPIDALPLEQFMHGPMVAVNAGDVIVLIRTAGGSSERTAEAARMWSSLDIDLWVVGEPIEGLSLLGQFELPQVMEPLSLLLTVVPMQMLAYALAVEQGTHPDRFRRDDPGYAKAFASMER